ncbi:hypothetical protein BC938DRAFT_481506 [Jimgerdemannia flammicorona]|uniref:Uncharacterized protein n=1 Tax=Jimgerdemannia flammicorona TaxID=994334 RepID=A0A433QG36_9FUNG|nr:hypothetical protein BC938DRAFT_481506 [Jimgerdemannia flammicorona]
MGTWWIQLSQGGLGEDMENFVLESGVFSPVSGTQRKSFRVSLGHACRNTDYDNGILKWKEVRGDSALVDDGVAAQGSAAADGEVDARDAGGVGVLHEVGGQVAKAGFRVRTVEKWNRYIFFCNSTMWLST